MALRVSALRQLGVLEFLSAEEFDRKKRSFQCSAGSYSLDHVSTRPDEDLNHALRIQAHALPVGQLTLVARNGKLSAILWETERANRVRLGELHEANQNPVLLETERQLQEYFAGTRSTFELELDFNGTAFQKQVWQALLTIPFGETRSYSQIARQIGNPKAVRAVGAANRRNPISIVARAIGSLVRRAA